MKPRLVNADSGEKTFLTPKPLIDALGLFDCDPCVPDGGMPWKTATRMITKSEDGLATPWEGRVWLNPPYGREAVPFLRKMASHDGGGIALLFVRTDTEMWHDCIFPYADAIFFLRHRVQFASADGVKLGHPPMPSALISYSLADTEAIVNSGIEGRMAYINTFSHLVGVRTKRTKDGADLFGWAKEAKE